jgi:hypothetical protein
MSHRDEPVSPNLLLHELLPEGWDGSVPPDVLGNLLEWADQIFEPARALLGHPIKVTSAWRPAPRNQKVGGVKTSDHVEGKAGDLQVVQTVEDWEGETVRLFHLIRTRLAGRFGQLILEDHRAALKNPRKLWVHVSLPTAKHPGHDDPSAVLFSPRPGVFEPYEEPRA